MSDTLRSYGGSKGFSMSASRRRGRGTLPALFVVLLVVLGLIAVWISRDTHDIDEFLPADQSLQLRVEHAIQARATLAESPAWSVLPGDTLAGVRESLQAPLPVPEWLAKNALNRELYWFGDVDTGRGVLVSRMTRVGTVAARLALFMPSIERDWAGGLNLATLPDEGLYFAVRGRILIAGDSRRAVIEALTLADDERAAIEGYLLEAPENARVAGVVRVPSDDAQRLGLDRIEFGIVSEPDRFGLIARGRLADGSSALGDLLARARPAELTAPGDAPVALALNVDTPLRELSITLGEAFDADWPDESTWEEWLVPPEGEEDRPPVAELLAQLGPELHVTIHGVDPNEVLPVPEIVIRAPRAPAGLAERVQAFPEPATGPSIDAVRASFNPESGILRIPAPGGESLEPSGAFQGSQFVFSTSLHRLNAVLAEAAPAAPLPGANNAYLRIHPARALDTIDTAGRVLVQDGLLEGHTPESFEAQIAEWREQFASIESVEAVLRTTEGAVELECEMRFAGP